MDNNEYILEAKRIANKLIEDNESKDDLDTIFNKLLKKEYSNHALNVMLYLPRALADRKYCISSISPFKLEKE